MILASFAHYRVANKVANDVANKVTTWNRHPFRHFFALKQPKRLHSASLLHFLTYLHLHRDRSGSGGELRSVSVFIFSKGVCK